MWRAALILTLLCSCSSADALVGASPRPTSTVASDTRLGFGVEARETPDGMARVELRLEPAEVEVGETVTATLHNTGQTRLGYGSSYEVERFANGRWRRVPNKAVFTLALLLLAPGTEGQAQSISVWSNRLGREQDLAPGLYRVTKDVTVEDEPPETRQVPVFYVSATFRVTG